MTPSITPVAPYRSAIKAAKKADKRWTRRITAALSDGNFPKAKAFTLKRLSSRNLKLVAADQLNRALAKSRRPALPALIELADAVNVFDNSNEVARLVVVPRRRGGSRETYDFNIADRIAQTMIKLTLEPFARAWIQPYQFAALAGSGQGHHAAIAAVLQHIDGGFVWVSEMDIHNFYGSINRQELERYLPLPPAVTSARVAPSSIMVRDYTNDLVDRPSHEGRAARRASLNGLLPGALVSNLVAAMLIGQILNGLEIQFGSIKLLVWSDNMLVLGNSRELVQETLQDLQSAFSRHPAGPLQTTATPVHHVNEGFEWIGLRFQRRPNDHVMVTPKPEAMRAFSTKALFGFEDAAYTQPGLECFQRWLNGWRAHYRHWHNCNRWTRRVINAVASMNEMTAVWSNSGRLVRFLSGDSDWDRIYPMPSDDDFSHWRHGIPYHGDMPG